MGSYWIRSLTIFDFHCTFTLLYYNGTSMMCPLIYESAEGCPVAMSLVNIDLPSILVSSLALYSVLLMASSTPYPESRVFVSEGVYKKPLCCKQHHPTIHKLHKWILFLLSYSKVSWFKFTLYRAYHMKKVKSTTCEVSWDTIRVEIGGASDKPIILYQLNSFYHFAFRQWLYIIWKIPVFIQW